MTTPPKLDTLILCAFPVFTGMLLHTSMPALDWDVFYKSMAIYGLSVFIAVPLAILNTRAGGRISLLRASVCSMSVPALLVLAGAVIPVPPEPHILSVHRSYYMAGSLGLLGGLQIAAIVKGVFDKTPALRFLSSAAVHGGVLLILAGAVLSTAFGTTGIMTLYDGGESGVYSTTGGPYRELDGGTAIFSDKCNMVKAPKEKPEQAFTRYNVNCSPGFTSASTGMLLVISGMLLMAALAPVSLRRKLLAAAPVLPVLVWALVRFDEAPSYLRGAWFVPHVSAYFTGYFYMFAAGVSALASLFAGDKRQKIMMAADALSRYALLFITAGLFFGSIWANSAWGSWWSWDLKESLALSQWLLLAAFRHLPLETRLSGAGAVVLFALLLLTVFMYLGIYLLPAAEVSLHVYTT